MIPGPGSRSLLTEVRGSAHGRTTECGLRWIYLSQNLLLDKNVDELEGLLRRSAKAGYTHVLLSDSKFAMLGDMDARYFRTI